MICTFLWSSEVSTWRQMADSSPPPRGTKKKPQNPPILKGRRGGQHTATFCNAGACKTTRHPLIATGRLATSPRYRFNNTQLHRKPPRLFHSRIARCICRPPHLERNRRNPVESSSARFSARSTNYRQAVWWRCSCRSRSFFVASDSSARGARMPPRVGGRDTPALTARSLIGVPRHLRFVEQALFEPSTISSLSSMCRAANSDGVDPAMTACPHEHWSLAHKAR